MGDLERDRGRSAAMSAAAAGSSPQRPVVVVIAGPQASGKTTLASVLAPSLRKRGRSVALVQLDVIAGMALPSLPDWGVAHRILSSVVDQWLQAGVDEVVVEGMGSREEIDAIAAAVSVDVRLVSVAVTAPSRIALERARRDPTRGMSREHWFLREVYDRWNSELTRIRADVVIDTGRTSVDEGVRRVIEAVTAGVDSR